LKVEDHIPVFTAFWRSPPRKQQLTALLQRSGMPPGMNLQLCW